MHSDERSEFYCSCQTSKYIQSTVCFFFLKWSVSYWMASFATIVGLAVPKGTS